MAVSTIDALYHSGSEKLTTTGTGIDVTGTVTGSTGITTGVNHGNFTPVTSGTTGARINANGNGMLRLASGGVDKMYVLDSGNVGIGTSSPSRRLHIHEPSTAGSYLQLTNTSSGTSTVDGFQLTTSSSGAELINREATPLLFSTSNTERMRIDATGAVTMPAQPAFSATKSAKQSNVAVSSAVTVVFDTEVFDQNADFSSNTFTAPVTGKYQLNLSLYTNEIDSAADYYMAVIKTSNREYQNVIDPGVLASDPVYWNQGVSVLADMDANDTAYVFIQQGNGNQQTDVATPSFFSGYLVA